ncbi:MAG: hypothetical protein KatS3mg094_501 [Candidatus Parcubacteria bacterium]|nr:MAG: hypothetical protein KatS3mg094_501 [Candidatus Parcubacteria bacterium]
MKKFIIKPQNLVLTISANKLTLIEIKKTKKELKIINKIEFNKNFISDSQLIVKENIEESLKTIKKTYPPQPINIILNIPKFFIQRFNIPELNKEKNKNLIENKIKEELPINIERYLWKSYFNPNLYENTLVLFFEKEILEIINNQLLLNNFIPLKFQLIVFPILNFIKEKYALAFDKSYLISILADNILTICTYENGFITNILGENIDSDNKKEIIERMIISSMRSLINPIDIIFNLNDESLDIEIENLKIINVNKELKLNTIEIASLNIIKNLKDNLSSELNLNIYNFEKEYNLYNLNNSLKIWLILSIFLGLTINTGLILLNNYLNKEKNKITNEISTIKNESQNLEKLKSLLTNLTKINDNLSIYKKLEILNNLKEYQIEGLDFQNKKLLIIIKESNENKKNEILNYLKNNLKLDDIEVNNALIKITIENE